MSAFFSVIIETCLAPNSQNIKKTLEDLYIRLPLYCHKRHQIVKCYGALGARLCYTCVFASKLPKYVAFTFSNEAAFIHKNTA